MHALYVQGATLEDVGIQFGLTRERVRQIFVGAGLPTRSPGASRAIQRARQLREKSEAICAAFATGKEPEKIALELGVPLSGVKAVLRDRMPVAFRHKSRPRPPTFTDAELLAFLRAAEAATQERPLTTTAYRGFAAGRTTADGRRYPAPQTIASRFTKWRLALREAGLPAGKAGDRGPKVRFDEDACRAAVRAAAKKLGRPPSGPEYESFARATGGRHPSLWTVRNRFDGWIRALQEAGLWDGRPAALAAS